jgi:recombinational DNA repair ATPase RecF
LKRGLQNIYRQGRVPIPHHTRALRSRNALLQARTVDEMALESFSRELVFAGTEIMRRRRELLPRLCPLAQQAYARIAHDAEELRMEDQPSVTADSPPLLIVILIVILILHSHHFVAPLFNRSF